MREGYARGAAVASALLVGGAAVLFAALQSSGADRDSLVTTDPVTVAPPQEQVETVEVEARLQVDAETPPQAVAEVQPQADGGAPQQGHTEKPLPVPPSAAQPSAAPLPRTDTLLALGRRVYDEEGCAACHSIAGVGGRRGALDGVGRRLDRETIRLWIVDPQAVRPGIRKPSYPHLSAEHLDALTAYMESLTGR